MARRCVWRATTQRGGRARRNAASRAGCAARDASFVLCRDTSLSNGILFFTQADVVALFLKHYDKKHNTTSAPADFALARRGGAALAADASLRSAVRAGTALELRAAAEANAPAAPKAATAPAKAPARAPAKVPKSAAPAPPPLSEADAFAALERVAAALEAETVQARRRVGGAHARRFRLFCCVLREDDAKRYRK